MENIEISMQKDPSLEHVKLIKVTNYDIRRGCAGFAKKGLINASFTYFEAKDVLVKYAKEKVDVDVELKKVNFETMES